MKFFRHLFFALGRALVVGGAAVAMLSAQPPFDKISPLVTQLIDRLKQTGGVATGPGVMNAGPRSENPLIRCDSRGRIGVHLRVSDVTGSVIARLRAAGGDVVMALPYSKVISVYLPYDRITEVAGYSEVESVLPISGGMANGGIVTTEGDTIHHAVDVRNDLGVDGDSVKVGVISDGCTSWAMSVAGGDLPAGFGPDNFTFFDNNMLKVSRMGRGDEGTAMMEIIHDLAPGAGLYFYGALHDPAGSAAHIDAIHRLVTEKGCRVIVDDLTWFDQPMFEDNTPNTQNMIAAAAQWATTVGVVYISSAGNFGGDGSWGHTHYQSAFTDVNPASNVSEALPLPNGPILPGMPPFWDDLQLFGPDPSQPAGPVGLQVIIPPWLESERNYLTVILEWNEPWGAASDEYDLYIYDSHFVTRRVWGTRLPTLNPYVAVVDSNRYYGLADTVNIVINHRDTLNRGLPPKLLGLYIFGCTYAEYHTAQNSIWGQPGVPGVIAVGAVNCFTPAVLEPFSSRGDYDVYFPNPPGLVHRSKPDLVAVDNVAISGAGGFGYFDPLTGKFRFLGTSAAAPHVAGMTALLLSQCPGLMPAQVQAKFARTAVDCGDAGFDDLYGYGRADIERALLELSTDVGVYGPYQKQVNNQTPVFLSTNDGFALNTTKVTGGISPPVSLGTIVSVTAASPFTDAGLNDPGCPAVRRWYDLTQAGGINGQFSAMLTAYVDESERSTAGIDSNRLSLLHWNGSFFDIVSQAGIPQKIGSTWKLTYSLPNASFSPYFIAYLTRGLTAAGTAGNTGRPGTSVPVGFSVKNNGNGRDTVSIRCTDSRGWTVTPADSAFSLGGGDRAAVTLHVAVPSDAQNGTADTIRLMARSVSDTSVVSSATVSVVIRVLTCSYLSGWNMVSVPALLGDYCVGTVYPTAESRAFAFDGNYIACDTLSRCHGYWVKFPDTVTIAYDGQCNLSDSIPVKKGWNIIGSTGVPVAVASAATVPSGIVTSPFFGYSGAYYTADTIMPGLSYWVKVSADGVLILSPGASGPGTVRRHIADEYPPPPPGSSAAAEKSLPDRFALGQNFPNPFNPTTMIRYQLPAPAHVVLRVYNALGQEVARLVDAQQSAGYREAVFAADRLPSGVYYYSINAGSFSAVKKALLLR